MTTILLVAGALLAAGLLLFWLDPLCYLGAPFSPTNRHQARQMAIELAGETPRGRVAELGAGIGTVVLEFALAGFSVDGFEINPLLARVAERRIRRHELESRARIRRANFWDVNLAGYDVVFLYQFAPVMRPLLAKLHRELGREALIVSNQWRFPGLTPIRQTGPFWIYRLAQGPAPSISDDEVLSPSSP